MSVRHNIPEVRAEIEAWQAQLTPLLREIARFADARISARAIGTYMRNTGRTQEKNTESTLRIQAGRLARAVAGGFGEGAGAGERESTVTVTITGTLLEYVKEITVPYAGIQEEGGTVRVTVTDRMRRYFWAQFRATGDEKYKWMALTRKTEFIITIPARPYLGPALDDELPAIEAEAERRLLLLVKGGA